MQTNKQLCQHNVIQERKLPQTDRASAFVSPKFWPCRALLTR